MKLFTLARATAAAALMATTAGAAWSQAPLLFNSFLAPQHPINTRVLKPWADEVAKVTQGRVRIEVTASSMGPPPTQVESFLSAALGDEELKAVTRALAMPPCSTCLRVNTLKTSLQVQVAHTLYRRCR